MMERALEKAAPLEARSARPCLPPPLSHHGHSAGFLATMLASCCKSGSASAMIQGSTGHRTQRKKAYVAYVALSWGHVFCLLPLKAPPSARKRSQPGRDLSRSPPETRKRSRSARSRGRNRNAPVRHRGVAGIALSLWQLGLAACGSQFGVPEKKSMCQ